MKKSTFLILFAAGLIILTSSACFSETLVLNEQDQWQPVIDLPKDLAAIKDLMDRNKPKKANKKLKKWIKDNPDSPYMDQALFMKGQAQFNRKLYYQAVLDFEDLLNEYGTSKLFEPALKKEVEIAKLFLAGKKRKVWGFIPASARTEALEILDIVAEHWPGSELAAGALMMQGDYYFQKGRYIEAQQTYQIIVDQYSKSRYYQTALRLNAESSHAIYLGQYYDGSCLEDAKFRYMQYQAHFPEDAEKIGVPQRLAKINWQQGQKEYSIADFYQRTKRHDSARYYCQYILERWPDTEWAEKARQMLDEKL
jgi:outer membrane protein assembly factor BamD (BamD/ComL family)